MSARAESMLRHPSGIARLVDDARDQQAVDAANRGRADAELHAGGPMTTPALPVTERRSNRAEAMLRHPAGRRLESPEVTDHRMDVEACQLANSGRPEPLFPDWVAGLMLAAFVYFVLLGVGAAGALAGGWPA